MSFARVITRNHETRLKASIKRASVFLLKLPFVRIDQLLIWAHDRDSVLSGNHTFAFASLVLPGLELDCLRWGHIQSHDGIQLPSMRLVIFLSWLKVQQLNVQVCARVGRVKAFSEVSHFIGLLQVFWQVGLSIFSVGVDHDVAAVFFQSHSLLLV